MKKSLGTAACLSFVALVIAFAAGCNTVKGAGKDLESAGEAMQDAAD